MTRRPWPAVAGVLGLLGACSGSPVPAPVRTPLATDASDDRGWHVLLTGQMPLADLDAPGVVELDAALAPVWSARLPEAAGGFGAVRMPGQRTFASWTSTEDLSSGAAIFDAAGEPEWTWPKERHPLFFPHGLGTIGEDVLVVADAWADRIQAIDRDGNERWVLSTADRQQNPSGMRLADVDGRTLLITTLLADGEGAAEERLDQVAAWWVGEEGPELAWRWPETPEPTSLLWPHGAQLSDRDTLLVSNAGLGQVVELSLQGRELARCPPDDGDFRFAFPRDAMLLPDGRLLVLDATELLVVDDPFGSPRVTAAVPIVFGYSAELLDCARGQCLGG